MVLIGARGDKCAPAPPPSSARKDQPDSDAAPMDCNGHFAAMDQLAPSAAMPVYVKLNHLGSATRMTSVEC